MTEYVSHSPAETEKIAGELAHRLKGGDVLAFQGGLGAGKTTFVRGLALGLGFDGEVSSPTFALVHEYDAKPPLYHFDLYRRWDLSGGVERKCSRGFAGGNDLRFH